MTAGIIHLCGAWSGKTSGPNRHNKKGMFENEEIRQSLVKPYLTRMGVDPMGQAPLPSCDQLNKITESEGIFLRKQIFRVIYRQNYLGGSWFYKGAKMCLVWPLWNHAFPKATWIVVRRPAEQIAASCMRTGFMRRHKDIEGWLKWVAVHEKRFREMKAAGLKVFEVWTPKIIAGDYSEIKSAIESYGLQWNEAAVNEFVSPSLWGGGR
jgi:hypothetical protein